MSAIHQLMPEIIPTLQALREYQPQAARTFETAISNQRLHHAYLLMCKEQSTSKQLALAVAQTLVCKKLSHQSAAACQQCNACKKLAGENHPDVITVEPDEKSKIRIEAIRSLTIRLGLRASESETKVVLLHNADLMNTAAQNALLKTLEEPPGKTCFLLTARRYKELLPTIRSRVQRLHLTPPSRKEAASILEGAQIPPALASILAALAGSDVELAQSMLDQGLEDILSQIQNVLQSQSTTALIQLAADLSTSKERSQLALNLLEVIARDGLANKWGAKTEQILYPHQETLGGFNQAAAQLQNLRRNQRVNPNPTMSVESVLLELTSTIKRTLPA